MDSSRVDMDVDFLGIGIVDRLGLMLVLIRAGVGSATQAVAVQQKSVKLKQRETRKRRPNARGRLVPNSHDAI